eukprot:g2677.t1
MSTSPFTSAVRYQGWVNPMRYASLGENGEMIFTVFNNLNDGAMGDDLVDAVNHHMALPDPMGNLREKRRKYLVGTSDCNKTINATSFLPHADLLVANGFALTGTFLNIGAKDGMVEDPCVDFARKYLAKGIHFEKNETECRIAQRNFNNELPKSTVQTVVCDEVTPMNIVKLLDENAEAITGAAGGTNNKAARTMMMPRHFDLIKIDIDSYDATVLKELLNNHFSAKLIFLEVNPTIPPPYQFATLYHPKLWSAMLNASMEHWPLRGMSLSYAVNFMKKWDYELVLFDYHDAVFVHRNYKQIYGFVTPMDEFDCYHKAFVFANGVSIKQTRKWFYETSTEQGVAEIFQHMVKHSLQQGRNVFVYPYSYLVNEILARSCASASDLFGHEAEKWKDDGLGGIYDQSGWTNRKLGDNTKIYKAHLIEERDKPGAGTTKLCPFDCDCCFGFGEDDMEGFLKQESKEMKAG